MSLFLIFASSSAGLNEHGNKELITALYTLAGGLVLFVISNIFLKLVLEPVRDMQKLIGEIGEEVVYYGNLYHNPLKYGIGEFYKPSAYQIKIYREGSEKLRRLAARLRGGANSIPDYNIWRLVFRLPNYSDIEDASRGLIFLHNSMFDGANRDTHDAIFEAEKRIKSKLKIKDYE